MHKAKKQITKPFLAALGSYWHLFDSFWLIFQGRMGEALLGSHETPGCLPSWKDFQGPQGKARHEGKGFPEELTIPRGGGFSVCCLYLGPLGTAASEFVCQIKQPSKDPSNNLLKILQRPLLN